MTTASDATIEALAQRLAAARRLLFITGAGLSADSGLPTYRGVGGLYQDRPTEDGVAVETALSGDMFRARPELTWRHLYQIESACRGAAHNAGHSAIAGLERHFERVVVLTQNVDGFHAEAGTRDLVEIHGNIHNLSCQRCDYRERVADFSGLSVPPRCPSCGAVIRPEVVLFGEMLPEATMERWRRLAGDPFDAVFAVGTTGLFPYIAAPFVEAAERGATTVEINLEATELTPFAGERLAMRAAPALRGLLEALERQLV